MKFFIENDGERIRFSGEITAAEVVRLDLDALDRALMDGPITESADALLVLEMIFRRHREQKVR